MKKATLTETKNNLSALIERVRHGESILILDRGRPVARIDSVAGGAGAAEGRVDRLERLGILRRAAKRPGVAVLSRRPPAPRKGTDAVAALIDERRTGR
jgi:prevent-host-death family protein